MSVPEYPFNRILKGGYVVSEQKYPFNVIFPGSYFVVYPDGKQNVIDYLSVYFNEDESFKNPYFKYHILTKVYERMRENGVYRRESQNTIIALMLQLRFLASFLREYDVEKIISVYNKKNPDPYLNLINQFLLRECQQARILPTLSLLKRTVYFIAGFLLDASDINVHIEEIQNEKLCDIFIKTIVSVDDMFYVEKSHVVSFKIIYDIPVLELKPVIIILENWDELFSLRNICYLYVGTVIQRLQELCIRNHVQCSLETVLFFALRITGTIITAEEYPNFMTLQGFENKLKEVEQKTIMIPSSTLQKRFKDDINRFLGLNSMTKEELIEELKEMVYCIDGEFGYIDLLEEIKTSVIDIDDYLLGDSEEGIQLEKSDNDNTMKITRKLKSENIELSQQVSELAKELVNLENRYGIDDVDTGKYNIQMNETQTKEPMQVEIKVDSYVPPEQEQTGLDRIKPGYMTVPEDQILREELEKQVRKEVEERIIPYYNQFEQQVNERVQQNLREIGIKKEEFAAFENDLKRRDENLRLKEQEIKRQQEEIVKLKQEINKTWNQQKTQPDIRKVGNQTKQGTQSKRNVQNVQNVQRKTQETRMQVEPKKEENLVQKKTEIQPQLQMQPQPQPQMQLQSKRQNVQIQSQGQKSKQVHMQTQKQPQTQSHSQTKVTTEKTKPTKTVQEVKKEQPMNVVKPVNSVTEKQKTPSQSGTVSKTSKRTVVMIQKPEPKIGSEIKSEQQKETDLPSKFDWSALRKKRIELDKKKEEKEKKGKK